MKKLVIILLLFVVGGGGFGQSWDLLISSPEDEFVTGAIENSFGNYILCGAIGTYNIEYDGYIIEISPSGAVLNSKRFSNANNYITFSHIFEVTGGYMAFGNILQDSVSYKLMIKKMDYGFNEIWMKIYGKDSMYHTIASVNHTTAGEYIVAGVSSYPFDKDIMFWKFNADGDSILGRYYPYLGWQFGWDMLENGNNTYKGFTMSLPDTINAPYEYVVQLDSNLNILSSFNLSEDLFPTYITADFRGFMTTKWLNDSVYMAAGRLTWKVAVFDDLEVDNALLFFNKNDSLLNAIKFGIVDTTDYAANHSLDFVDSSAIYVGGTVNANSPTFSGQKMRYSLYKFDFTGNMLWEKYYGGDASDYMYKLIATQDSGCLMVGTKYDWQTANGNERDIWIVKVGPDGLFVSAEETMLLPEAAYKIYPNPASGYFYIQGSFALPATIELYDLTGRQVYRQPVNSNRQRVDVSQLSGGLYVYRLVSGGKVARGKVVIE